MLAAECDDYTEEESQKGINFPAFMTFQKILIRKLKMEICWTILRFFGYSNSLEIKDELWDDHTIAENELSGARCFEIKKGAIDFL